MSAPPRPKSLLILSQVYVPDPASVGQHMADFAVEMARRGHRVSVYCSARGYENPSVKYPRREKLHGVDVRRLPFASFGKKSIPLRVAGTFVFMLQVLFAGMFHPNVDAIFFSTSPPLVGIIASIIHIIRGVPIVYWAMDLNPDQLIALGKLTARHPIARLLEAINRLILRESSLIITLDRFMAGRIESRGNLRHKLLILPPWPHDTDATDAPDEPNPFRRRHNIDDAFVVMYSGNHSPANPLTTLLDAAVQLKDEPGIRFLFVGGGGGKKQVEQYIQEHQLKNALSLPYQPMGALRYSLSAADVHVVSMGDEMVGIVHPCKIYGAMSVGRPILYLGPRPSHISDLLEDHPIGWHVSHGDVDAMVRTLRDSAALHRDRRREMGRIAQRVVQQHLTRQHLSSRLCAAVEAAVWRTRPVFPHVTDAVRADATSTIAPTTLPTSQTAKQIYAIDAP